MEAPRYDPPSPNSICYILYSPADAEAYARNLSLALQASGRRVAPLAPIYLYRENPAPGQRHPDAVVFIASAAALKSRDLLEGLNHAYQSGISCAALVYRPLLPTGIIPEPPMAQVDEPEGFDRDVPSRAAVENVGGVLHGFEH